MSSLAADPVRRRSRTILVVVAVVLTLAALDAVFVTVYGLAALRSTYENCAPYVPAGFGDAPTVRGSFSLVPLGLACDYTSQDGLRHASLSPDWSLTISAAAALALVAGSIYAWSRFVRRS